MNRKPGLKISMAVLPLFWVLPAFAGGIEFFHGSFDEAMARARAEKKMVFVDVYAQWCAPCKRMAKTVFMQDDVGTVFNRYFVSLKVDAEDEAQQGPDITRRYEANPFPTYLFLDSTGKVVARHSGAMGSEAFKKIALSAAGVKEEGACTAYEAGDKSIPAFLRCFAHKDLERRSRDSLTTNTEERIAQAERSAALTREYQAYLKTVPEKTLLTAESFTLITNAPNLQRGAAHTDFLVQHYKEFARVVNPDLLAKTLVEANTASLDMPSANVEQTGKWVEDIRGSLAEAYAATGSDPYEREKARRDGYVALGKKDWKGFLSARQRQIELVADDPLSLNDCMSDIGSLLEQHGCDDKSALRAGAAYMALALGQKEAFVDYLVYSRLLSKLGEKPAAHKALDSARRLLVAESDEKKKKFLAWQLDAAMQAVGAR